MSGLETTHRYTAVFGVGIITTDEQLLASYAQLLIEAMNRISQELAADEMFAGKLELFPIDEEPSETEVHQ